MAHIYSKFFGQLPLTLEEFVSSFNKYFPHVIDTKLLINSNPLLHNRMKNSNTSLSSAFVSLCPRIALGFKSSHLLFQTGVNVEVHVDDLRFASTLISAQILISGPLVLDATNNHSFNGLVIIA